MRCLIGHKDACSLIGLRLAGWWPALKLHAAAPEHRHGGADINSRCTAVHTDKGWLAWGSWTTMQA